MTETTQQYSARLTGYVQGLDHLKVLQSTPKNIARLVKGKPTSALSRPPAPGKWSVAEILAHLAEGEIVFAYRLRMIVSANGIPIQAYDQDIWQSHAGYLKKNPRKALDLFTELRNSNIAFLKSLLKEQWARFGIHAERGEESVGRMAELYAGHDVNHLTQVESLLKSKKK
jgi:hypothetical protein